MTWPSTGSMRRSAVVGVALVVAAWMAACASPLATRADGVLRSEGGDVSWMEITELHEGRVRTRARERALRMGHDEAEAALRAERAWLELQGQAEGGPVLEIWMSSVCEGCLDLRQWQWTLVEHGRGARRSPRRVESELMHQEVEERTILDVSRSRTRSWVRGRLVFPRGDLPAEGRTELVMRRPEPWAAPLSARWWRGRLGPVDWVKAWADRVTS